MNFSDPQSCNIYSFSNFSGLDFVKIKVEMCNGEICNLMIDNGAAVSVFNRDKINENQIVFTENRCVIKGVAQGETRSFGTTKSRLIFEGNFSIFHEFQVMPEGFLQDVDGILGRDFLKSHKAKIDYETYLLDLKIDGTKLSVPLYDRIDGYMILPPRSETIRRLDLKLNKPAVVLSKEIASGVFVANSVVADNNALVKFVNTNLNPIKIYNFKPDFLPFDEYRVLQPETIRKIFLFDMKPDNYEQRKTRIDILKETLKLDDLPEVSKFEILKLCERFIDIFHLEGDLLTTNNFYTQNIELTDNVPVFTKNYRIPHAHQNEINRQVDDMLKNEIISPSFSPYNSPMLLVPKKNLEDFKKWRVVVDFRNINKKVVTDVFPLPRIDEILDQLGRARFFTVLDLSSGFHQIKIDENSKKFTAFSTNSGHYHFNRLPFGLKLSPNAFQRMMTIALSGLTPEACFLYIDDVIVFGCSERHHNKNLEKVFEAMRKHELKLNPEKCFFLQSSVTYLGHQITNNGILPDPNKYSVVKAYPVPGSIDDVRRFVSFCSFYRRFVPKFAEIAYPLNRMLKKDSTFDWTDDCQKSFETLKMSLISPPILQFPDFAQEFVLTTDASDIAMGAVLSQIKNGQNLPICYASKSFKKHEKHLHPSIKECLAIHWSIDHFKPYLIGRHFTVFTDHRPLIYLFGMKAPTSKLTRIRLDLESYDFTVKYLKGRDNVCADALSRIDLDIDDLKAIRINSVVTRSMTRRDKLTDTTSQRTDYPEQKKVEVKIFTAIDKIELKKFYFTRVTIYKHTDIRSGFNYEFKVNRRQKKIEILLFLKNNSLKFDDIKIILLKLEEFLKIKNIYRIKISQRDELFDHVSAEQFKFIGNEVLNELLIGLLPVVNELYDNGEILNLIKDYHDNVVGGHVGMTRLYKKISSKYKFRHMKKIISDFVKKCKLCNLNKHFRHHKELTKITDTPNTSFQTICIDTIGPLTLSSRGNRYILSVIDELTKYVVLVPIKNKESTTIARAFVENFVLRFGCVENIKSDMGTEYLNSLFKEISVILNMNHRTSTPHHPQSIASLERNHRNLNEFLRSYVNDDLSDWDDFVPFYEFCFNTTPSSITGYSPFELVFGKNAKLPQDLFMNGVDPLYNLENYARELKFKLQVAHERAKLMLEKEKVKRKNILDSKISNYENFNIGDQVNLKQFDKHKLEPLRRGPFTVVHMDDCNASIKDKNGNVKLVHKNLLLKC